MSPITIYDGPKTVSPQLRFANPVQYWVHLNWNLANLPERRILGLILRYEDVLADPQQVMDQVAQTLGIAAREGNFDTPKGPMKRLADGEVRKTEMTDTGAAFDDGRYRAKTYLDRYGPEELAFMQAELDPLLIARLGYDGEEYRK